jgi:hypothetical protein
MMMDRRQVYWRLLFSHRRPCAGDGVIAQLAALSVPSTATLWISSILFALGHVILATLVRPNAPVYPLDLLVVAWIVLLEIDAELFVIDQWLIGPRDFLIGIEQMPAMSTGV